MIQRSMEPGAASRIWSERAARTSDEQQSNGDDASPQWPNGHLTLAEHLASAQSSIERLSGDTGVSLGPWPALPSPTALDFDFYASTPEGLEVLAQEGDVYRSTHRIGETAEDRDARESLFVARIRFLRGEGGRELFNEFTPDRANLSGDALLEYDGMIDQMIAELDREGRELGNEGNVEMDPSLKYIIASAMVESFGSHPRSIEKVIKDINDGWIVVNANQGLDGSAGWYGSSRDRPWSDRDKRITFDLDDLIHSYAKRDDQYDLVAHEAAHSLDAYNRTNLDGVPTYMYHAEHRLLVEERDRLLEIFNAGGRVDAASSGLGSYTFKNREEFWANISSQFLSGPVGEAALLNASPRLYDMLRIYFHRDDLPPAEPVMN